MTTASRRRLRGLVALLLLAVLLPLLRANAAHQQQVWAATCVGSGGTVWTLPAPPDNPLVVQPGRPTYECRSAQGVVQSVRD